MPNECIKLTEKTSKISLLIKYFSEHSDPDADSDQLSLISLEEIKSYFFRTTYSIYYRYI